MHMYNLNESNKHVLSTTFEDKNKKRYYLPWQM